MPIFDSAPLIQHVRAALLISAVREPENSVAVPFVEAPRACVRLEGIQANGGFQPGVSDSKQPMPDALTCMTRLDIELVDPTSGLITRDGEHGHDLTLALGDVDISTRYEDIRDPPSHFLVSVDHGREWKVPPPGLAKHLGDS